MHPLYRMRAFLASPVNQEEGIGFMSHTECKFSNLKPVARTHLFQEKYTAARLAALYLSHQCDTAGLLETVHLVHFEPNKEFPFGISRIQIQQPTDYVDQNQYVNYQPELWISKEPNQTVTLLFMSPEGEVGVIRSTDELPKLIQMATYMLQYSRDWRQRLEKIRTNAADGTSDTLEKPDLNQLK